MPQVTRLRVAVAAIAARELAWDASRIQREVDAFTRQCEARLAWRTADPRSSKETH